MLVISIKFCRILTVSSLNLTFLKQNVLKQQLIIWI